MDVGLRPRRSRPQHAICGRRGARGRLFAAGLAAAVIGGCGGGDSTSGGTVTADGDRAAAIERATEIQREVDAWAGADTLEQAQGPAARVRALIGGPSFAAPGASVTIGLLPGPDGGAGLASAVAQGCVERDVLGGSWADPAARWAALEELIRSWTPEGNPFPTLPSHAQRTFGWATLTTDASTIDEAREYAGHAAGHAAVVLEALRDPDADPCPG